MTRNDIRKAFRAIGYKVSFVRNPVRNSLCNIAFQSADMLKPCAVCSAGVYSAEFRQQHDAAFSLALSFVGVVLEDTEQKIL